MLEIINNLKPFMEDNYLELGVREYSRILKLSPPTASKILKGFEKENLLKKREERGYLLFRANKESYVLKELSIIYWKEKLIDLTEYLESEAYSPTIVLFGSLSKLEASKESDIDLAIFTKIKKEIKLNEFEKKFGREIQLFIFKSLSDIKNKELKNNILNGNRLKGRLK